MAKRKVILVTAFENGAVTQFIEHFQKLLDPSFEIQAVIQASASVLKSKRFLRQKLKKALKIGVFGVLNGIRMRSWYLLSDTDSIQQTCLRYHIPFHSVNLVNDTATIELIGSLQSDLGVSMGNSFISSRVFKAFKDGMINTHGEILPDYQNAQSVIWQIYNGSRRTGFTIHQINEKIDQGAILHQEYIDILFSKKLSQTVQQTNKLITNRSLIALLNVVQDYNSYVNNAKPQGVGTHYTTPGIWAFLKMSRNNAKYYNENTLRK